MQDDLVKRLRLRVRLEWTGFGYHEEKPDTDCQLAADRITALEAGIRKAKEITARQLYLGSEEDYSFSEIDEILGALLKEASDEPRS